MIPHFHILGSQTERPSSVKTIFADGSADKTFRPDVDMELSHWIPNRTPERFKADTSTEICMNFVAEQSVEGWDLAINNHMDVDGVLSIFTLVHSEFALQHRDTIVQAAEMGDFWSYGERPAQVLFQGLTLVMEEMRAEKADIRGIYEACFEKVFELIGRGDEQEHGRLEGEPAVADSKQETRLSRVTSSNHALSLNQPTDPPDLSPAIQAAPDEINLSISRIESGEIVRTVHHERFVHYALPSSMTATEDDLGKALHIPSFNSAIFADEMWLLPQARNRLDREKVQLVSAAAEGGWYYDLHYPGYMWAETPDAWRAPGFAFTGSTNAYYYGHQPLEEAVRALQKWETGDGEWTLVKELSPFSTIKGRNFPVVVSFVKDEQPARSQLAPEQVAELLAKAFVQGDKERIVTDV